MNAEEGLRSSTIQRPGCAKVFDRYSVISDDSPCALRFSSGVRVHHQAPTCELKMKRNRLQSGSYDCIAFVAAALAMGLWHLNRNGLGNLYYTAADISGSRSLRALFFSTFDRMGVMAVDKPPLGLVGPAAVIRLFGVSSWSVLGPQVVMFAAGVGLLVASTGRWFSRRSSLLVGVLMLVTPINVAVARSNNPDALFALLLIGVMVSLVEFLRTEQNRYVVVSAVLFGLAFNTKLLQVIIVLPAVLICLGLLSTSRWQIRALRIALFSVVSVLVGSVWIASVDRVRSAKRPYLANAAKDRAFNLAFGFNGTHRIAKLRQPPGWVSATRSWWAPATRFIARLLPTRSLFGPAFTMQTSWLLLASLGAGLYLLGSRRDSVVRFLATWTTCQAIVLAYAPGKFSAYYLVSLVPGMAVLVGVAMDSLTAELGGFATMRRDPLKSSWVSSARVAILVGLLVVPSWFGRRFVGPGLFQFTAVLAVVAVGASVLAVLAVRGRSLGLSKITSSVTLLAVVACASVVPLKWTFADIAHREDSVAPNAVLVPSYPAKEKLLSTKNEALLLSYVAKRSKGYRFAVATNRVFVAAKATIGGQAVLPLGGFFGTDPYPRLGKLITLIAADQLRWVALAVPVATRNSSRPMQVATLPSVQPWLPWVRRNCRLVRPSVYGVRVSRPIGDAAPRDSKGIARPQLKLFDCASTNATASFSVPKTDSGIRS